MCCPIVRSGMRKINNKYRNSLRRKNKYGLIIKALSTFLCILTLVYAFSDKKDGTLPESDVDEVEVIGEVLEDVDGEVSDDEFYLDELDDNYPPDGDDEKLKEDKSFSKGLKNGKISNVLISKVAGKNVTLFYYGEEKTFAISNAKELEEYVGWLCDIEAADGTITKVSLDFTVKSDYMINCNDEYMVFEDAGKIYTDANYVIIKEMVQESTEGEDDKKESAYVNMSDLNFNNEKVKAKLFLKDNKICGVIYEGPNLDTISVLLKNNDYTDITHSKATISSKNGIIVKTYNNSTKVKITKDVNNFTVTSKDDFERIIVTGVDNSLLSIDSLKRSKGVTYHGSITIIKTKKGLVMVNTLPLEKYLYGVLPSEMPASFGKEAYKAQAICARTYALDKIADYRYKEYGATLDDSTTFQVYNKNPRTKEAIEAVDSTKGMVLVYKEKLAKTCYFSTSCGYIASAVEVFGNGNKDTAYEGNMMAKLQTAGNALLKTGKINNPNMKEEKVFKEFIDVGFGKRDADVEEYIEENCNWFRWKTSIPYSKLENRNKGSKWDVGKISEIIVLNRCKSGVVDSIKIVGSNTEIVIEGQSDIRKYLAPMESDVVCRGEYSEDKGEFVPVIKENMKMLPSGFFYLGSNKNEEEIIITGGGYGHGTGMSQYGAMWLSKAGFTFEEILEHYFNDSIVVDSSRLINP